MDGKVVKNSLLLRKLSNKYTHSNTGSVDFALETKVSEARRMFVSTRRYPLNFILRFPPFNDLMLSIFQLQ